MITVPDRSTAWLTVNFEDKDGAPEAPSSISYRVDTSDGAQLRDWTNVVGVAQSVELTLTPDDNAIANEADTFQINIVTVKAVFGPDDERNETYSYRVKNLRQIANP